MASIDQQLDQPVSLASRVMPYLIPKPYTGTLWLDVLYLFACAAIEQALFNSGFSARFSIDLMTPWLVTAFILQPLSRAVVLAVVGGLLLETSSTAPAGLYICIYWVIAMVISLVRNTLSWRHGIPWLFTFVVSSLWIGIFEAFVASVTKGADQLGLVYCMKQLSRMVFTAGIGMLCYLWWRSKLELSQEHPERSSP